MFFKPPPGPVDSSQHFSDRLLLRVCKNILHSNIDKYQFQYILHILISQSKQQTDWIYFLLSGDSRWAKYLCLSLWWWELSSCQCHLWQVRAKVLHRGRAALQSLQLQSPPLVCTDNVKVRARSRPWWRVSDMINGELRSAPATLVWGVRREGIAGRGLPTLVGLTGYYQSLTSAPYICKTHKWVQLHDVCMYSG